MRTGLAGYVLSSCGAAAVAAARQRAPVTAPLSSIRNTRGGIASPFPGASALHQDRSAALRTLALAHDAEPPGDLGIGLQQTAEIAAETVLVELLAPLDVPHT